MPLGIDQSRGAEALDRGCRGKNRAGATAFSHKATGNILVRHRYLGFPEQPVLQFARTTSRECAESVERSQLRQMLMSRLLTGGIVNQILGMQAELCADKFDDLCWNQFAGCQHPTGIAQDA